MLRVPAYCVNDTHIIIKCPNPKKCLKSKFHRHGSCGELHNRIESRCSHCSIIDYHEIEINDDTLRCDLGKTGKPLKRSFRKYLNMKKGVDKNGVCKEYYDWSI